MPTEEDGVIVVERDEGTSLSVILKDGERKWFWEVPPDEYLPTDLEGFFEDPDARLVESFVLSDTDEVDPDMAANKGDLAIWPIEFKTSAINEELKAQRAGTNILCLSCNHKFRVHLSQNISFLTCGFTFSLSQIRGGFERTPGIFWRFVLVCSSDPANLKTSRIDVYAMPPDDYDPSLTVEDMAFVEKKGLFGTKMQYCLAEVPVSQWIQERYEDLSEAILSVGNASKFLECESLGREEDWI